MKSQREVRLLIRACRRSSDVMCPRVADLNGVKLRREAEGSSRNALQDWFSDFGREVGRNYLSHGVNNVR